MYHIIQTFHDILSHLYSLKLHLFDIDVPGRIRFQESEILTQGKDLVTFDTGI